MEPKKELHMGYKFLVAAFCCTWAIHLIYLLWLTIRWRAQQSRIDAGIEANAHKKQTV
jgi:hypothetical protein